MNKFVIFDLEATCYDGNRSDETKPENFDNEIIEIGAIMLDHNGKEISRFSRFAKPKLFPKISNFCNELTTITQEDIDNAEPLEIVLEKFLIWAENAILISWGMYDRNQIKKDLSRNNLHDLTLDIDQRHFSLKHLHGKWNNLRRGGIGMNGALKMEGLSLEGTHHRGIDDAINIAKIFRKYIDRF